MNQVLPNTSLPYIGRFAPSPTGPLHFGSLVAAVGSYLQAKTQGGLWLVRMEDLDPPREMAGAADSILRTLDLFGLHWDGPILYQSRRTEAYMEALDQLHREGVLYSCSCSRKQIAQMSETGPFGPIYPGHCRAKGRHSDHKGGALRVQVHNQPLEFGDRLFGPHRQRLESEVGDFVVRRADGLFAYQLAVVVDDNEQGITEVVRGRDLLDNTPRQIYLQQLLNYPQPNYTHLPLALNSAGQKLSKQSGAEAIDTHRPQKTALQVLHFLRQAPPPELQEADLEELWRWAVEHWDLSRVPTTDQQL